MKEARELEYFSDSDEMLEETVEDTKESLKLVSKEELLINDLLIFYREGSLENYNTATKIINQDTIISLRLLDWLVTNFAKLNTVEYDIISDSAIVKFDIHIEYKNKLKIIGKKNFDPFARRQRIFLYTINNVPHIVTKESEIALIMNTYNVNGIPTVIMDKKKAESFSKMYKGITTTIGQLNFFKWAITNKVIDFAFANKDQIEKHMIKAVVDRTDKKKQIELINKDLGANEKIVMKRVSSKNSHRSKSSKEKIIVKFV